MTGRPVPAKLTAIEGLVAAILGAAGHVEQITAVDRHEAYLQATAPCVSCGVRRHLDDLQPVEDVTCRMIPGDFECVDGAACKTAQKGERL